jgi:Mn2+/Fe2+ NRAMP family transporter
MLKCRATPLAPIGREQRDPVEATGIDLVSSNRTIMGEYVNGRAAKYLGWPTAVLMAVAAVALFATGGV